MTEYRGGRVGCPECGDEYWDRSPGQRCGCGEPLIEFSERAEPVTPATRSDQTVAPTVCSVDIPDQQ